MSTEPLPSIESLDEAVAALDIPRWPGWAAFSTQTAWSVSAARNSIIAHARTLDKLHGRTPVDPDLIEARKIASEWNGMRALAKGFLAGEYDTGGAVPYILKGIKRGRELAR